MERPRRKTMKQFLSPAFKYFFCLLFLAGLGTCELEENEEKCPPRFGCKSDQDCQEGYKCVCVDSRYDCGCVESECKLKKGCGDDSDCPGNQSCLNGECVDCLNDADCPADQRCHLT